MDCGLRRMYSHVYVAAVIMATVQLWYISKFACIYKMNIIIAIMCKVVYKIKLIFSSAAPPHILPAEFSY